MIEKAFENLDPKAEKRIKELTDEVERLALLDVGKSLYCECDFPLIRTAVNCGEYCGNCNLDLEQ